MPLYEYECPKDGTFERMQKFSDPPVTVCPTCGGPVQKLLSAPAIQFKGTGWYITDYARKGSGDGKEKGEQKDEKKDSAKGSSSSETKASDAKPAASGAEKKGSEKK